MRTPLWLDSLLGYGIKACERCGHDFSARPEWLVEQTVATGKGGARLAYCRPCAYAAKSPYGCGDAIKGPCVPWEKFAAAVDGRVRAEASVARVRALCDEPSLAAWFGDVGWLPIDDIRRAMDHDAAALVAEAQERWQRLRGAEDAIARVRALCADADPDTDDGMTLISVDAIRAALASAS